MKIFKYITVAAAVLFLSGCITDNRSMCEGPDTGPGMIRVRLTVSAKDSATTRASVEEVGFGAENSLKDIIIMVFGHSADASGKLEVCERFVLASLPPEQDRWENESTLLVENVNDLDQPKNVYVIANWTGYAASNYQAGTTTESTLLAELSSISAPIATPTAVSPMLMSGGVTNYVFANNSNKATVGMSRQAVKIRLRVEFDEDFTDLYGSRLVLGGSAGDIKMRAVNVPNSSFVICKTPAAAPLSATLIHYPFTRSMKKHTTPSEFLADSCYVFENPVQGKTAADKELATSLVLNIPYSLDGVVNTNNYYRIYIDNSAETDHQDNPYVTWRNYIYDIKTTVKGFGMSEELAVPDALKSEMTIKEWGGIKFTAGLTTDDTGGNIDGDIDPWNPNGNSSGGDDIGSKDPEDEIDDTDSGETIDPWDPNKSGTDL